MRALVRIFLGASLGALLAAPQAGALIVSGTIRDAANNPIPGIRVEVNHLGPAVVLREAVFADAAGAYSSSLVQPGDNIYLVVKWDFALQPVATYGGHVVTLVARGAGDPFVATTSYLLKISPTTSNVMADFTLNLAMDQVQPAGLANVRLRVNHVVDYLQANKGAAPWTLTADVPVNLITDDKDRMSPTGIFVDHAAFDGTGTSFDIVTAYHEVAHWLHYHHNGNSLPPSGGGCGTHTLNSEEDPGCALKEGYASYLAQLVAEANGVMSPFYRGYRDDGINTLGISANMIWRGDEPVFPTGFDGMTWESGANVEGAVSGFLFGVSDVFGFDDVLGALIAQQPQSALGLLIGLSNQAGAGSPPTLAYHAASQLHGLVWSRGRFASTPFNAGPPPNAAPPAAGNQKIINGFTFLRGVVPAQLQMVAAANLGVGPTLTATELRVGVRPATAGILTNSPVFLAASPYVPVAVGTSAVNTLAFGIAPGDGDWDLAVQHKNGFGFEDDFLPTWTADGNVLVESDELYLKTQRVWFDQDGDPLTNSDPQGMAIVDNTAPTVSNFKP